MEGYNWKAKDKSFVSSIDSSLGGTSLSSVFVKYNNIKNNFLNIKGFPIIFNIRQGKMNLFVKHNHKKGKLFNFPKMFYKKKNENCNKPEPL